MNAEDPTPDPDFPQPASSASWPKDSRDDAVTPEPLRPIHGQFRALVSEERDILKERPLYSDDERLILLRAHVYAEKLPLLKAMHRALGALKFVQFEATGRMRGEAEDWQRDIAALEGAIADARVLYGVAGTETGYAKTD